MFCRSTGLLEAKSIINHHWYFYWYEAYYFSIQSYIIKSLQQFNSKTFTNDHFEIERWLEIIEKYLQTGVNHFNRNNIYYSNYFLWEN